MNNAMIAIVETWLGSGDAALQRLARAGAAARELRHRLAEAMIAECTGWMHVSHGRYEEAEAHLRHGLALAREIGAKRYETMCLMLIARVLAQRGAHAQAREYLRDSWALSERIGHGFIGPAVQGVMALTAREESEREAALVKGEALLHEGSIAHCHIWFIHDAIETSLASGKWTEALRHADALEKFTVAEPLPWTDFHIATARALADAGRGHPDRDALLACREMAIAFKDVVYLPTLDATLARLAAH